MQRALIVFLFIALAAPAAAPAQTVSLPDLIDGVERRLGRIRDLSADFVQIYEDPLNQIQREEGHLYLRRPRMMRWEYSAPEEKLFVSDGSTVYFYVPAARQVSREAVGETFDERIPIMFLLGRSELQNEFVRIEQLAVPPVVAGTRVLRMIPRRSSDVEEVWLEVEPETFDIRRLRLRYVDGAVSEFRFDAIRTNTGLETSMFDFEPPPGVEVIEGIGR